MHRNMGNVYISFDQLRDRDGRAARLEYLVSFCLVSAVRFIGAYLPAPFAGDRRAAVVVPAVRHR